MPIRTGIPGGRRATEPEADPSISPGCASASPKVTPRLPARHRRPRASPAERLCPPARPRGAEPSGAGRGVRGWACGAGERRRGAPRPPAASQQPRGGRSAGAAAAALAGLAGLAVLAGPAPAPLPSPHSPGARAGGGGGRQPPPDPAAALPRRLT